MARYIIAYTCYLSYCFSDLDWYCSIYNLVLQISPKITAIGKCNLPCQFHLSILCQYFLHFLLEKIEFLWKLSCYVYRLSAALSVLHIAIISVYC